MKLQLIQKLNSCGPTTLVYFKIAPMNRNKPDKKKYSLKVEIKTQPGQINSKKVFIYVPIFKTRSAKALLNLLVILKNILKVNNLNNGQKNYATTKNILTEFLSRNSNKMTTRL